MRRCFARIIRRKTPYMNKVSVTVNAHIDGAAFKRFARFDTFTLRHRWVLPIAFALILSAFAAVAFFMRSRAEQAPLIGWLLLGIGLLLPAAYFLHYELQLNAQVRRLGIKKPRPAYFVTLTDEGVRVVNNMAKEAPLVLTWDHLHGAYRRADAIYLYHTENRAFILPAKDASVSLPTLWDTCCTHLPKEKVHG